MASNNLLDKYSKNNKDNKDDFIIDEAKKKRSEKVSVRNANISGVDFEDIQSGKERKRKKSVLSKVLVSFLVVLLVAGASTGIVIGTLTGFGKGESNGGEGGGDIVNPDSTGYKTSVEMTINDQIANGQGGGNSQIILPVTTPKMSINFSVKVNNESAYVGQDIFYRVSFYTLIPRKVIEPNNVAQAEEFVEYQIFDASEKDKQEKVDYTISTSGERFFYYYNDKIKFNSSNTLEGTIVVGNLGNEFNKDDLSYKLFMVVDMIQADMKAVEEVKAWKNADENWKAIVENL